jgi:hypothetical protein
VHCLSNLHNFIETYGENKAVEWQKNFYHGACALGNFNVVSPLRGAQQKCETELTRVPRQRPAPSKGLD